MSVRDWFKKFHSPPSDAAVEAAKRAKESQEQAAADLVSARRSRVEAERVILELRRHNTANRYDEWLTQIGRNSK